MSKLDVSKITKGEAVVEKHPQGQYYGNITVIKEPGVIQTISCQLKYAPPSEQEANAALYVEAHNVANECGMGPREMKEKLDEAVRLLKDARDKVWNARLDEARRWGSELEQAKVHANKHTKEFDDFLSTLTK